MTRNNANEDELPEYEWVLWVDPEHPDYRWVRVSRGDLPCPVEIRCGSEAKAGRFVCTGLRVGAPDGSKEWEVSARMLRAIREGFHGGGSDQLTQPFAIGGPTVGQLLGDKAKGPSVPKGPSVRRGRKGLDPETLRHTAEFYRQALEEGTAQPLAATAARLDVWPSTPPLRAAATAWEG